MPKAKKTTTVSQDFVEVNLDELRLKARKALEKSRFQEAITSLEIVTRMVPEHSEAWNNLGVAHLLAGNLDDAESCFRGGLEVDPENPQIIKNLIQTLLQMENKVSEGLTILLKFIEIRPTDKDALYMLARCLQAMGDNPKAEALFKRVIELDPDYTLAIEGLKEITVTELPIHKN